MDEQNNDGLAYAIIGFILILVIIFVVVFAIKQFNKNYQVDNTLVDNTPKHFTIESYWRTQRVYDVNYELWNGGAIVQQGQLRTNLIEKVQELRNNTNYTLKTKDSRFYDSETVCNSNILTCKADLYKYPQIQLYALRLNEQKYRVVLYLDEGVLKDPAICVADNTFRIQNIKLMDSLWKNQTLGIKAVPTRMRMYYDKCYSILTKQEIVERIRNKIAEEYENNIKKYNKEHKLNLGDFNDVDITDEMIMGYKTSDIMESGLYEYDLTLDIDTIYGYNADSNMKIILIDQFSRTRTEDIDVLDKELIINLSK
jgi:hypothetical protein